MEKEGVYLKKILTRLAIFGVWSANFGTDFLNSIHRIYSQFMLAYFSVFIISQITELFYIESRREITENLSITLLYFLTWNKIIVSKSNRIKNLIEDVHSYEKIILEQTFKKLYMDIVNYYRKLDAVLLIIGFVVTLPFFVAPIIEDFIHPQVPPYELIDNLTLVYKKRPLPLSSWFPYDKYKYYYTSFVLQVIAVTYGASCLVLTDCLLLGLMVFFAGRLKILQEKLKTFRDSKQNIFEAVDKEEVRRCAVEHQNVIRNIKELDLSMKFLMFLDFVICSVQIAISAFWVIVTTPSIQLAVVLIYFVAMIIQLFLFYGFANNVSFESTAISLAIWNSKWYECSQPIKRSLLLILLRSQKPLTLTVGPFYAMSNQMALAILRTAYSYVAVLSKTYDYKQ